MANRASSSFARQSGDDYLTCKVCHNQYRELKSLPCLHTLCRDCIERYATEQAKRQGGLLTTIACPTCRAVNPWNGADSMRTRFFKTNLLGDNKMEVIKCNVCHDRGKWKEATGRCVDCGGDSLCDACSSAHRRTRLTKEHHIVPIDYAQEAAANQLQRMQTQGPAKSTQQKQHSSAKAIAEDTRTQTRVKSVDDDYASETCKTHRGQQITTVCLDCKTTLCVLCLQDLLQTKDKQNVHTSHQLFTILQSKGEIRKEIKDVGERVGARNGRLSEQVDETKEHEERLKEKNKTDVTVEMNSVSPIQDAALSSALTVDIVEKHAVKDANVSALTMGPNGEFIFVDSNSGDIIVFRETFKLLNRIKNLREPIDVDTLPDGNVAVTEGKKGHCVSVVSLTGELLAREIAKDELTMATAIAVCGSEGLVVVSDEETCKVHVIRLENGKTETLLFRQGPRNQFAKPNYVACSSEGSRLAVSDKDAHCVKVFNSKTGQFIFKYGAYGCGPRQLKNPADVCFDGKGRLFICDTGNSRVHVVSPDYNLIGHISPKHFKKFEPPPKLIALRKDGCLVLANAEGWVKVIRYKIN